MANRHRGEIEAVLDGRLHTLCLTLGALAELESAFGAEDMLALATRFERGRISARDAQRVIAAGLRGAGHDIDDEAVGAMQVDGGAAGFVTIVADLLSATFSQTVSGVAPETADAKNTDTKNMDSVEDKKAGPFPGTK